MSAFMVNKGTIDQLVYLSQVPEEKRNETGQMLIDANTRSMAARYGDGWDYPLDPYDESGGEWDLWHRKPYRYESHTKYATPAEGIMLASCLDYQSCEYDEWGASDAKRFLMELVWGLAGRLDEVRATKVWEWREE